MTWSVLCVFDSSGNPLIRHKYRSDIPDSDCDMIMRHIALDRPDDDEPFAYFCNASSIFIVKKNIYLSLSTKSDPNCLTGYNFLYNIYQLILSYIGYFSVPDIKESSILIREILEEAMDFGIPQITDFKIMKEYITHSKSVPTYRAPGPPAAVTNAVSFRAENITYMRNEVFIDIIEELNFKMNANGAVTLSEIIGSVILRVYLSGMPELKLTVNNKLPLKDMTMQDSAANVNRDIKFHQCISQKAQGAKNALTFVPPDGKFALINYRMSCPLDPMFSTQLNVIQNDPTSVTYNLVLRTAFPDNSRADTVDITIPVAEDLDSPRFTTSAGSAKYQPDVDAVVWKLTKVATGSLLHLNATFNCSRESLTVPGGGKKPVTGTTKPMEIQFSIPFVTLSGMQVLSLDVYERSHYQTEKFVSYVSRNGKVFQY